MRNILSVLSLLVSLIVLLPSCNKEDKEEINDYLPLKVGAKYKYNYLASYAYVYESSLTKGECTWKFISMSTDMPAVYQVEQSFTGYSIYYHDSGNGHPTRDSTQIENQISTLIFEVQNDGKVAFTFPMPYWGASKVTF